MSLLKRGLMVAGLSVATMALAAMPASADISPDPASGTATGELTLTSLVGSTCDIEVELDATDAGPGSGDGAVGQITSFVESNCSGIIDDLTPTGLPWDFAVAANGDAVISDMAVDADLTFLGLPVSCNFVGDVEFTFANPGTITFGSTIADGPGSDICGSATIEGELELDTSVTIS